MDLNFNILLFLACIHTFEFSVFGQKQLARVIGGKKARDKQFPYVVAIIISETNAYPFRCTGSILDESWVLTAAHCYRDINTKHRGGTRVIAGTSTSNEKVPTTQVRYSKRVIIYEESDDRGSFNMDVALVEVKVPFAFNEYVKRIHIAKLPFPTGREIQCKSMGFGMTSDDVTVKNNNLNYMDTIAHDYEYCLDKRPSLEVQSEALCTEPVKKETATCSGDSGGPLLCQGVLVGVLSGTAGLRQVKGKVNCTDPNGVTVSMFTGYFESWIREYIPDLPESQALDGGGELIARSVSISDKSETSEKSDCRRITFDTCVIVILMCKCIVLII